MIVIEVNGELLDMKGGEVVALTIEQNDIADFSKRKSPYTNDFTLPLTSRNSRLLGFIGDRHSTSREYRFNGVDALLKSDSLAYASGKLYAVNVDDSNNTVLVRFLASGISWIDQLKGLTLQDLDLSDLDHTHNDAAVNSTWASSFNSQDYVYIVADRGQYETITKPKSGTVVTIESKSYYHQPVIFVRSLLQRIMSLAGFSLRGTFLQTPDYQALAVFASNQGEPISSEYIAEFGGSINRSTAEQNVLTVFVPVTWNLAQSGNERGRLSSTGYTADADCVVDVTARITVGLKVAGSVGGSASYVVQLVRTDTEGLNEQLTSFSGAVSEGAEKVVSLSDTDVVLSEGQRLSVLIRETSNTTPSNTVGDFYYTGGTFGVDSEFTVTVNSYKGRNGETDLAKAMPDMTLLEFIKELANRYALVIRTDLDSREVQLDTLQSLVDKFTEAVDWTGKLDHAKSITRDYTTLANKYAKLNEFRLEIGDDDIVGAEFLTASGKINGEGDLGIAIDALPDRKTFFESKFSSVTNTYNLDTLLYQPYIPLYNSDREPEQDPGAVLLLVYRVDPLNLVRSNATGVEVRVGSTQNTLIGWGFLSKVALGNDIDNITTSLAWQAPEAYAQDSLFDNYWSFWKDRIENGYLVKCHIRLTEVDILRFTEALPVYIGELNGYFYVNKIEQYRPDQPSTAVELVAL